MSDIKGIRENEQSVDPLPQTDAGLFFIGQVRTPWNDRSVCPRQGSLDGPECQLVVDELWQAALQGLEEYEYLEVLYWMDQSRRDLVRQCPKANGEGYGTFALRSPVRPNPIATSIVRLVGIENTIVTVRGLDCLDGTPLLDIKPERSLFTPKAGPKRYVSNG